MGTPARTSRRLVQHGLGAALALLGAAAAAQGSDDVVGGARTHRVEEGDTWRRLAARYAVEPATLARINGLSPRDRLEPGDELRVVNHHIVPRRIPDGVVVNVPQRMLFVFRDGDVVAHYPVGIGRRGWTTPAGRYRVDEKEVDPSWEVPPSIQREMRRKGQRVVKRVAPGPDNPLGARWIGLNRGGIGIHGTPKTDSLFGFVSHGCIRMHPDDVEAVYDQVEVGTTVEILYEPVLLARDSDGQPVLEVHPDAYRRQRDPMAAVRRQAEALGLREELDWATVRRAISQREGIAVPLNGQGDSAFTTDE
jgi:L,D-transpeptidase ErfK/SrfK